MSNTEFTITHTLEDVCRRAEQPLTFIAEEEQHYEQQILTAADTIAHRTSGRRLIMQCGPSSVGKTTTAAKLCRALTDRDIDAVVVSMDDFYRGICKAPRLPDGRYDYESPYALDLEQLHDCITELMTTGRTMLPRYDFPKGAPAKERRELVIGDHTAVIFEGIHAFSPLLCEPLKADGITPFRVFVNTRSRFTDGEEMLLCRRDIRLSRRLLRDERTRASSYENTMQMWQQVVIGDDRYILPYRHDADVTIDTTMGYEPCLLAPLITARLHTLSGTAYEETARRFEAVYRRFPSIPLTALPADSLLREFVG